MRLRLVGILTLALTIAIGAFANGEDSVQAQSQVSHQLTLLRLISPYVERQDLGRIRNLQAAAETLHQSLTEHGPEHAESFQAFQANVLAFRYSRSFLKGIEVSETEAWTRRLLELSDQMSEARGFDDAPYSKILSGTMNQMRELLSEIARLTIRPELKVKIQQMESALGMALAKAGQGDRPKAFAAAIHVHGLVAQLNPDWAKLAEAEAANDLILQLQGLNGFLAEYAQIEVAR